LHDATLLTSYPQKKEGRIGGETVRFLSKSERGGSFAFFLGRKGGKEKTREASRQYARKGK